MFSAETRLLLVGSPMHYRGSQDCSCADSKWAMCTVQLVEVYSGTAQPSCSSNALRVKSLSLNMARLCLNIKQTTHQSQRHGRSSRHAALNALRPHSRAQHRLLQRPHISSSFTE
eukprot:19257-Heterococcus_DN1.PRE.2